MKKKLFAILMSAMMLVTFMPAMAFAATPIVGENFRVVGVGSEHKVDKDVYDNFRMVKEGKYQLVDTEKMKTVSADVAAKKSKAIIIDTMPASFYGPHHIPGAINAEAACGKFSPEAMRGVFSDAQKKGLRDAVGYKKITKKTSKKAKKAIQKARKNTVIYVYCGFCGCDRSHQAAKYLVSLGYKKVYRYAGGAAAWEDAGCTFVDQNNNPVVPAA